MLYALCPMNFQFVISLLEWIWFLCLLVMTGYHMVIFKRKSGSLKRNKIDWPGVSIIIAHKNGSTQFSQNLDAILSQDYPVFEVIIIDDHSLPAEKMQLEKRIESLERLTLLSTDEPGKKNALTKGVNSAKHDVILCTDADCKPVSDQWIRKMVETGRIGEVVLGYSPYQKKPGWLNLLIRFETVMTAIQYMSWTLAGKPYMGVGRNMLYPRTLFLQKNPYTSNPGVPYGDDDLLVQALKSNARFKVCDDLQGHVISEPALTWKQWLNQKHRHLSAGHYYKTGSWLQPGIYGASLVFHWFITLFLMTGSVWWKWLPVLLIGMMIRWITFAAWSRRLGDRDTVIWYPLLEVQYALYLGLMGIITAVAKKKSWN